MDNNSKKMTLLYEETIKDLEQAVETALTVNDKLRCRYDDLPLDIKQKIVFIENNLLGVIKDIEKLTY